MLWLLKIIDNQYLKTSFNQKWLGKIDQTLFGGLIGVDCGCFGDGNLLLILSCSFSDLNWQFPMFTYLIYSKYIFIYLFILLNSFMNWLKDISSPSISATELLLLDLKKSFIPQNTKLKAIIFCCDISVLAQDTDWVVEILTFAMHAFSHVSQDSPTDISKFGPSPLS